MQLMAKVPRDWKERREERNQRTRTRVVRDEMAMMDMDDVVEANRACLRGVVGEGERVGAVRKTGTRKPAKFLKRAEMTR